MSGTSGMSGLGGVLKFLGKYWAALLAVILFAIAAYHVSGYGTEQLLYESKRAMLEAQIASCERSIQENARYADIQEQLEPATAQLDASRQELYDHFPRELLHEDQIMYVLYLETKFGTEIYFEFDDKKPLVEGQYLSDGSILCELTITVNYETTYEGFKEMLDYLSTDDRITSVRFASIQYDAKQDIAKGEVTLRLYMLESELLEYMDPDIAKPETGKDIVFE